MPSPWKQQPNEVLRWEHLEGLQLTPVRLKSGLGFKRHVDTGSHRSFNGAFFSRNGIRHCFFRGNTDGRDLQNIVLQKDFSPNKNTLRNTGLHRNEDPRVFSGGGRDFISTSYLFDNFTTRIELRELQFNCDNSITYRDVGKFDHIYGWPGYSKPGFEKNWSPFFHGGEIFYVYSVNPHRILQIDYDNGIAELAYETSFSEHDFPITDDWFRLSANPIIVDEDRYLSSFHVRSNGGYYHGFYTFLASPPFPVISVSSRVFIGPDDSTCPCWRNSHFRVCFVQGMELEDGVLLISGGDSDEYVAIFEVRIQDVMGGLRRVKT